ncbi:MAG TPA: tyrosine-type recombinase/integrase [Aggregatilineaceae bacterium]|nr:tyrosine-type recombinase/integrase [Aggregatilineaceae bacterium]
MKRTVVLDYVAADGAFADWLKAALAKEDVRVLDKNPRKDSTIAILILLSPYSLSAPNVLQTVDEAKQDGQLLIPILIQTIDKIPWYVEAERVEDFTIDRDQALRRLVGRYFHKQNTNLTFGEARDLYLNRATLKSAHTIDSYRRALDLFFNFLEDRTTTYLLPIQKAGYVTIADTPITELADEDAPILLHFAQWLLSPGANKPSYKAATVELRLAGVQNWLQFLDDYGWLPRQFPLAKAKRIVRDQLNARSPQHGPPQPPDHMDEVIYYYDRQELPPRLKKPNANPDQIQQWELTRLRNRALLHALAETGGRISEILSLNLDQFPPRYLYQNEVLRVEVAGKGGHAYYLRFLDSLPAIRAYIEARGSNLLASAQGNIPLFVSHDARYNGSRMSRIIAWRVVQRAALALGLRDITPHDFRHWRATQLINAGHSLDVVQDYLGHRSVETTRAYYAHTDPLRVDDAAKNTHLPPQT